MQRRLADFLAAHVSSFNFVWPWDKWEMVGRRGWGGEGRVEAWVGVATTHDWLLSRVCSILVSEADFCSTQFSMFDGSSLLFIERGL